MTLKKAENRVKNEETRADSKRVVDTPVAGHPLRLVRSDISLRQGFGGQAAAVR